MRNTLEISGILLAVLLAAMAFHAWLTEHDDRLRMQATIATQKQALDADTREHDRAATLKDTPAQIDALKRQTQTPAQVIRDLPKLATEPSTGLESPAPLASAPTNPPDLPDTPSAQIPAADLKPLFDYVQDCRSCQAQLAAAKQNATDNATKLTAVTLERDAAVATAKAGTFWQRLHRNALWFVVGAGAGAVAVCGKGHCR
jgi:hypothetical protein